MFFKRRSSRANSYVEHDAPPRSQSFDEYAEKRPDSSRKESQQQSTSPTADADMYPRQQQPQETASLPTRGMSNGGHSAMPPTMNQRSNPEPMPDLLAQAFNQAIRPYTEKIEQLEHQLADMQAWVDQLEQQRAEVHSWIDKRGLRPDVPPSIAKIMDTTTPDAAIALNAQLDRKITIVNFDLHRLQDDLNDSISSSHFASAMLKFLPDIQRLALLPQGPRHAFDLVLKLGGNLNSHGAIDSADPGDIAARRDFYQRLDTAMVDVVTRRFGEGEDWNVQREIKRIEKTATYLKTYGVEPYFPQTLEMMKRELEFQPHNNGAPNGQGTPPRVSREFEFPGRPSRPRTPSLASVEQFGRTSGPYLKRLSVQDSGLPSSLERTISNLVSNRHGQLNVNDEAGPSTPTRPQSLRAHIPSPRKLVANARLLVKPKSRAHTLHCAQIQADPQPTYSQQQLDETSQSSWPLPESAISDVLSSEIASTVVSQSNFGSLPNSNHLRPPAPPQELSYQG